MDIGEVNKFTVDFGFVPALLSGKDVEAVRGRGVLPTSMRATEP